MKKNYSKEDQAKTDVAWRKLRARIENEEVIEERVSKSRLTLRPVLSYAAAFLLIITVITLLITNRKNDGELFAVTITNDTPGTTFVTKLDDGSYIYLSERATVVHPQKFNSSKREVELSGEAYFEIARDENKPFIIDAGDAIIEVLGTTFDLLSKEGETKISVRSGRIKISHIKSGESVEVSAGESAVAGESGLAKYITEDLEHFNKYTSRMHFKDEYLANITDVINRTFPDTKIELEQGLEIRELTATFTGDNPDSMVQLICSAMELKYKREGGVIKIHQ